MSSTVSEPFLIFIRVLSTSKISSFDKKLELLEKKNQQAEKLHKEQVEKQEKLSGMSANEAREELVQSLKEQAKTETLELTQNIIEDA